MAKKNNTKKPTSPKKHVAKKKKLKLKKVPKSNHKLLVAYKQESDRRCCNEVCYLHGVIYAGCSMDFGKPKMPPTANAPVWVRTNIITSGCIHLFCFACYINMIPNDSSTNLSGRPKRGCRS